MTGRHALFAALIIAIVCSSSNAAVFLLNVLPAQSTADVTVSVSTPLGNGSDTDSSPLGGFVLIETDTPTQPFSSARIIDLSLTNTDSVALSICVFTFITCQAGVDVDAVAGDIMVDMNIPGPSAVVTAGAFTQVNNEMAVTGLVDVDATGLADGQIPEGAFVLDGDAIGDIDGDLTEAAGVVELTIQIAATISETDDMTGVTTDTTVDSTVVATGTQVAPGDMDCSGDVTIADVPLFVQALLEDPAFAGCSTGLADVNEDGLMNGEDVAAMIAAL